MTQVRAVTAVRDVVADLTSALAEIDRSAHPGVSPACWAVLDERCARARDETAAL